MALAACIGLSARAGPANAACAGDATAALQAGETCRHHVNWARFLPCTGSVDIIVALAEGCVAARRSRAAAAQFLAGLERLRRIVIEMNMARLHAAEGPRRAAQFRRIRSVSRSGEFLIAHRMGPMRDVERWRRLAPGFSIAFR